MGENPDETAQIGSALRNSRATRCGAALTSIAAVGCHLFALHSYVVAASLVGCGGLVLGLLARWDRQSLGLRFTSVQPFSYWAKATVVLGLFVLLVCGLGAAVVVAAGGEFRIRFFPSASFIWPWLFHGCLMAPLVEEGIYRFVLCAGCMAVLGRRGTIAISGIVFAALHIAYGTASLDNQVAGYLLAWAYLKSRSITVPLLLHALGNLATGLFQVLLCLL